MESTILDLTRLRNLRVFQPLLGLGDSTTPATPGGQMETATGTPGNGSPESRPEDVRISVRLSILFFLSSRAQVKVPDAAVAR